MPAKRTAKRRKFPTGMYEPRPGYYVYRSPISGRTIPLGRIPLANAMAYANHANQEAFKAKAEDRLGRLNAAHDTFDARGLLDVETIAARSLRVSRRSGIYFLLQGRSIVYVGQSTHVDYRVGQHFFTTKTFDRVHVLECPEEKLDHLESLYIDRFRPIYNARNGCATEPDDTAWSLEGRSHLTEPVHSSK